MRCKTMPLCYFTLILFLAASVEAAEPCGIRLDSLDKQGTGAGDLFEMRGKLGNEQGHKKPTIADKEIRFLEVISWSDTILRVRVPEYMKPGSYRVAVWCAQPRLGEESTSQLSFVVTTAPVKYSTELPAKDISPTYQEETSLVQYMLDVRLAEDYSKFEQLADDLLKNKRHFADGEWKLETFYRTNDYYYAYYEVQYEPDQQFQFLERWQKAFPESVTPRIALAAYHKKRAWKARGGGYISEVSENAQKLFYEHLTKAWDILREAEKLPVKDPALYDLMIDIGWTLGKSKDEVMSAYKKGIALEPTYYSLYATMAHYLQPKWGGAPGAVEQFAADTGEATKLTEGEGLYARIAIGIFLNNASGFFSKYHFLWPRMKQGFADNLRKYPGYRHELNLFTMVATLANDQKTAKEWFAQLGPQWDSEKESTWNSKENFEYWVTWADGKEAVPGQQEIFQAAQKGDLAKLNELIAKGVDLNARNHLGNTALMMALREHQIAAAKLLIEKGADVNAKDRNGWPCLFDAVETGDVAPVKAMIEKGALLTTKSSNWDIISIASYSGQTEVLSFLLKQPVLLNDSKIAKSFGGPLHAAANKGQTESARILIKDGRYPVNARDNRGSTPLHLAAEHGYDDIIKVLVQAGGRVDFKNDDDLTPLGEAEKNGRTKTVELLKQLSGR